MKEYSFHGSIHNITGRVSVSQHTNRITECYLFMKVMLWTVRRFVIGRLTDLSGEIFTKVQLIFFKGLKSKASSKKKSSIPVVEFNKQRTRSGGLIGIQFPTTNSKGILD